MAGFWRRFFAFAIDSVVVAVIAAVIAIPFFELLSDLGPTGRIIGFFIGLVYFAIPESAVGGGQSIGKRFLKLRVVNSEGNAVYFEQSLVHYTIFAIPCLLGGLNLTVSHVPWLLNLLLNAGFWGLGGSTLYLLTFNRSTRQGLHDLAVKSYVVEATEHGPVDTDPIWKGHLVIAGTLFIVLSVLPGILLSRLAAESSFPQMQEDIRVIAQLDGVQQVGASEEMSHNFTNHEDKRTLVIKIRQIGAPPNQYVFADEVAKLVLQSDPTAKRYDQIRIEIVRGYELGIVNAQRTWRVSHSPIEWRERLSSDPA